MRTGVKKKLIIALFLSFFAWEETYAQTWVSLDGAKVGKSLTTEILESNANTHKVRMTLHGFQDHIISENGIEYHQLLINDTHGSELMNEGDPQLPTINHLIAIPEGASYRVSLKEEKWQDVEIGTIYPVQRDSKDGDPVPNFIINDSVYSQEQYAPTLLRRGIEQNWCYIRCFNISICPFKYYPQQNRLSVLTEFVLQVDFIGVSDNSPVRLSDLKRAIEWNMFDNDINCFPVRNEMARSSSNDYDYLIIVGDNGTILNSQALKDFTKWKAFKGYKTKVVSTTTTGATTSSIKSYIYQEYINYDMKYVLLIGDYDKIPLNVLNITTEYPEIAHGDYWYGCLVGGNNDYFAEIPIGRISTNILYDFQNMVNKTITYERFYNGNTQNALLIAHKQNPTDNTYYQVCCENIRNAQYSNPLSFTTAYGASGATNNDVIDIINNGKNIVNYRGHGTPFYWSTWNNLNESFGSSQIGLLDSTSIFFNVCCKTGDIKEELCMMEMLTRSSKGATACLAAVDFIWRWAGNKYNQYLFSKLLNNSYRQIGELNIKAHHATLTDYANDELSRKKAIVNAWMFLCGGDPTLEIWTSGPYPIASSDISFSKSNGTMNLNVSCLSNYKVSLVSESGACLDLINSSGHNCTFPVPTGNFYAVINSDSRYPYIMYFSSSNYLQNETIYANSYYNYDSTPLNIGYDVTTTVPYGNVTVKSGSKLSIKNGTGGVTITKGFECEKGAELVIQ